MLIVRSKLFCCIQFIIAAVFSTLDSFVIEINRHIVKTGVDHDSVLIPGQRAFLGEYQCERIYPVQVRMVEQPFREHAC